MSTDYSTLAEVDVKIQYLVLAIVKILQNPYIDIKPPIHSFDLIDDIKMINLKKLISSLTVAVFILVTISPSYAATSIHISPRSSDIHVSTSEEVGVSGNESFFGGFNFNDFFKNLFGNKFKAEMDGTQEIPGPGDADGEGRAKVTINIDQGELCADLEVENIDPANAAHIHFAPAGASGAVVAMLPIPDSEGKADGCESVDSNLLQAVKDNPQDYYINVHTGSFPNGAIRGQLSSR